MIDSFWALGTRAPIAEVSCLAAAQPVTHTEALDLPCLPDHFTVPGCGFGSLELAQSMRRFGFEMDPKR